MKPSQIVLLICSFLLPCFASSAGSQSGNNERANRGVRAFQVTLNTNDLKSFAAILTSLNRQTAFTFLAEGRPLAAMSVEGVSLAPVTNADGLNTMQQIADAYDYTVEQKGSIFYFKKRYSDPRDLPDVTIAECLAAMQAIERSMRLFNPRLDGKMVGDSSAKIAGLDASLSADQRRQLATGLTVVSLSSGQKREVFNICLNLYVEQNVRDILSARVILSGAEQNGFLEYCAESPNLLICFDVSSPPDFRTRGPVVLARHPFEQENAFNRLVKEPLKIPEPSALTMPLRDVVATLNRHPKLTSQCHVEEALASKTITGVGMEKRNPREIMESVAAIYGLRLVISRDPAPGKSKLVLSLPKAATPRSVTDLPSVVRTLFPDPLARSLNGRLAVTQPIDKVEAAFLARLPKSDRQTIESKNAAYKQFEEIQQRAFALPWLAGRQLEETYTRWSLRNLRKPLPITDLTAEEKSLVAIVFTSPAFAKMAWDFGQEVPAYIGQFEQLTVRGGPYRDPERGTRYKMSLLLPNPNGGDLIDVAGVSNMPYKLR